jgi:hypothetical protein
LSYMRTSTPTKEASMKTLLEISSEAMPCESLAGVMMKMAVCTGFAKTSGQRAGA